MTDDTNATDSDEPTTYCVTLWWKTEADFHVDAETPSQARQEAIDRAMQGMGTTPSPTRDEILSADVTGVVDGNKIYPLGAATDDGTTGEND